MVDKTLKQEKICDLEVEIYMISTTAMRDGQIRNVSDRVWKYSRIPSVWHPWDPTGVREYALTNYFSLHHKKDKKT